MSKVEHNPSRRPTLAEPQWVFITPEMAKELVSVEGTNRKIRQSVVEQYTSEMEDGMWHYSPHGIVLDQSGRVSDGNHRMQALADADVAGIWMLVADWRIEAGDLRVDMGTKRSLSDFNNSIDPRAVQASVSFGRFLGILPNNRKPTPDDVIDLIDDTKSFSSKLIVACPTCVRGRSSASVRAGFLAFSYVCDDHEYLAHMYRSFVMGEADRTPPLITLARAIETKRMDGIEVFARTFYSLEAGSAEKVAFKAIDNVLDRIRHQVRPKFITSTP